MNSPRLGLCKAWRAALLFSAVVLATRQSAQAEQITVDWTDTEIQKFTQQNKSNFPLAPDVAAKVAALKLPVLAFDSVPQLVKNASPADKVPAAPSRQLIMNEADPTWYQLNDQYGDITISVLASLSVNRAVAKSTIYQPPTPSSGSTPSSPPVSVFDENGEPGFTGMFVEYAVYKFPNIPYIVTIECTLAQKDKCSDLAVVAQDMALLKVIAATPPATPK